MSNERLSHSILNGKATVEVWETHPHPAHGPVVERTPQFGDRPGWQRRTIFDLQWSRRSQGYEILLEGGSTGWYPERNVRNLRPLPQDDMPAGSWQDGDIEGSRVFVED